MSKEFRIKLSEDERRINSWRAEVLWDQGEVGAWTYTGSGDCAANALRNLALVLETNAPQTGQITANPVVPANHSEESTTGSQRTAIGYLHHGMYGYKADKVPVTSDRPSAANAQQVGGGHYKTAIEHWDYVLANDIPYLEAQIIKYLTRWRKKNGLEDVRKAKHFLEKLLEVETAKGTKGDIEIDKEFQEKGNDSEAGVWVPNFNDLAKESAEKRRK